MASLTKDDEAKALELLTDTAAMRREALKAYPSEPIHQNHDEDTESDSPIIDFFVELDGQEALLKMTKFSRPEFDRIYKKISDVVTKSWNTGRGRKTVYKAKDVFFMAYPTMKCGSHWDYIGSMFRIKGPVFQRMVKTLLLLFSEELYEGMVVEERRRNTMRHFPGANKLFKHHPHALYATDVTFQQTNRPSGNHQESKGMFSVKRKLYGYKMEISVFPTGLAACASAHRPGSVSDLTIFREMYEFHNTATEKGMDDVSIPDHGSLRSKYPNLWAVLADKGYQGAADELRVLYPKKKKPHKMLSVDEEQDNKDLSSDRVIGENYFGRMTSLWEITSRKYRWTEELYDPIVHLCVALANIHIFWHPLRDTDGERYQQLRNKWFTIGERAVKKRKEAHSAEIPRKAQASPYKRFWAYRRIPKCIQR